MAAGNLRYSLYGKITKIDQPKMGRDIRMYVLSLECTGGLKTQTVVSRAFMDTHKPEVGYYLLRQLDDTTVVVDEEVFQRAEYVELPCCMELEEIN